MSLSVVAYEFKIMPLVAEPKVKNPIDETAAYTAIDIPNDDITTELNRFIVLFLSSL